MEDRLTARKEQYCQQYTVASLYSLCLLDRLMISLMLCFSLLSTFSSVATAAAFLTIIAILLCRTRPSPPRAFLPLPVTAEVETDAEVSGAVEGLGLCSGLPVPVRSMTLWGLAEYTGEGAGVLRGGCSWMPGLCALCTSSQVEMSAADLFLLLEPESPSPLPLPLPRKKAFMLLCAIS